MRFFLKKITINIVCISKTLHTFAAVILNTIFFTLKLIPIENKKSAPL